MIDANTPENTNQEDLLPEDDSWLVMARDAFEQSTGWFDASLRKITEKALAHFAGRHAPGSKYHAESYKYRSKGFRPKTRATIRRNEAAAAVAFFSTQDMVSVTAENEADQMQLLSATALSEVLNYRLDDSIPWFQTLIGAYQDALNVGVCISHQSWEFTEAVDSQAIRQPNGQPMIGEDGQPMMQESRSTLTDKPVVDLVALENFRISPASNWVDPIGTTPYIIELIPMHIGDVREKMESGAWITHDDGVIQQAAAEQYDSIRAAREGKRTDKNDIKYGTTDFDTVFVHRNIVRKSGDDWVFYTIGTQFRLTDPVLLQDMYRHLKRGERPYVMGYAIIETHKAFPSGLNELISPLQEEANEIGNQRRDNVSLVMNKRYFAKRNANIDFKSLTRNVPGSITLMDDINTDLKWDSPGDVTGSSYQEQDRVSLDFDEIAGSFSPGSVQSNRQLGETVGGMQMLGNDANQITEYQLRVFAQTFAEPVLKQLVKLIQAYETDELILAIAGQKAKIQQFGVDKLTDDMLQAAVTVRVNVGFGATNPQQRIQKLTMGLGAVAQFAPQIMQGLEAKEIITEIFGALGYKGAERFFPKLGEQQEDPQVAQLKQELQQLQQYIQTKQAEQEGKMAIEQFRAKEADEHTVAEAQLALQAQAHDAQEAEKDRQSARQLLLDETKKELAINAAKLNLTAELAVGQHTMDMHTHRNQAASPVIEPAGRAPNGESFQK